MNAPARRRRAKPIGLVLGEVAAFAGGRVDPDTHALAGRRVLEALVGRTEARVERLRDRLAAARAVRRGGSFGFVGSVPVALHDGRDHQDQPDEHGPHARGGGRGRQRHRRQAPEHEERPHDEHEEPGAIPAEHRYSIVVGFGAGGLPSASTTTAVPYATISDIVPDSSDESKRIDRIAFAPVSVALRINRSSAWRRVSSSRLVYSWISPPPSERSPAMRLPPMPRLRTTSPKTMPF